MTSTAPSEKRVGITKRFSHFLWSKFMTIDLSTDNNLYIMRSVLAAALALIVAYWLEVEMPFSAASTVLLVINPMQGAVIGKGAWRIIGTLLGMFVSILLMAFFGQMPLLFIIGFGFWLGICVAGMTLFRHFRGSGMVVAGYTIGLATYGALGHAEHTFEHVLARGSSVVIGVLCLGLVTALFSQRKIQNKLLGYYQGRLMDVARYIGHDDHLTQVDKKNSIISEIYAIDDLLAVGKAESEALAQKAALIRQSMSALFSALIGGVQTEIPTQSSPLFLALKEKHSAYWDKVSQMLAENPCKVNDIRDVLQRAKNDLHHHEVDLEELPASQRARYLIILDRLNEQIDDFLSGLDGFQALIDSKFRVKAENVYFHRDYANAFRNGLRSMLAIVLAGLFWLQTGWKDGDMMLLVMAPYCALLATSPHALTGAWGFYKGTMYALPAAFICSFVVMPHIDGLPLLLVVLALFWIPGIYATCKPQTIFAGLAYLVAFNTMTAPNNPMIYDLPQFLNFCLVWIFGTLFAVLTFYVILPRSPQRDVKLLQTYLSKSIQKLLKRKGKISSWKVWQHKQQHRISQLAMMLKTQPVMLKKTVSQGTFGLHLGRELVRLQSLLTQNRLSPSIQALVENGLTLLSRHSKAPTLVLTDLDDICHQIEHEINVAEHFDLNHEKVLAAFADIRWSLQQYSLQLNVQTEV